jgi:hypothetical protein
MDRGHCKMNYENGEEIEYCEFYDFTPAWEGIDESQYFNAEETDSTM